jgi:hypothetical protein
MQYDGLPYFDSSRWCIDLAELDLPPSSQCSACGRALAEHDGVFVEDGDLICSTCLDSALAEEWPNAVAYAREDVQLTGTPEVYEPELRHACTPDEYAMGAKESYTLNSVFAFNRHNRTTTTPSYAT